MFEELILVIFTITFVIYLEVTFIQSASILKKISHFFCAVAWAELPISAKFIICRTTFPEFEAPDFLLLKPCFDFEVIEELTKNILQTILIADKDIGKD